MFWDNDKMGLIIPLTEQVDDELEWTIGKNLEKTNHLSRQKNYVLGGGYSFMETFDWPIIMSL